jgi:hypothetical protein
MEIDKPLFSFISDSERYGFSSFDAIKSFVDVFGQIFELIFVMDNES